MAEADPSGGPSGRAEFSISKPSYPKPIVERINFAEAKLDVVEQYIAPNSAVLASLLIRALLPHKCSTAEAMWAVYRRVQSGRYVAYSLHNRPPKLGYIVSESNPPAGLDLPDGVLHLDSEGESADWSMCILRLLKRDDDFIEKRYGIDSRPALPLPPTALVDSAERDIPGIMANVLPLQNGTTELIASWLVKKLQDGKHTLAASQWAIHKSIQAGRLRTGPVDMETPSYLPRGSKEWQGGERTTIPIPEGEPTPFDSFKVITTESLWDWWRSLGAEELSKNQSIPVKQPIEALTAIPDRPSPFTISHPVWKFAEGPPSEPAPVRSLTLADLMKELDTFADEYERANFQASQVSSLEGRYFIAGRDATAERMKREFLATTAIGRVRSYILANYGGADLTIRTARRLLGDLIRTCSVTVDFAEALTLEAAMDRLENANKKPLPPATSLPSKVRNWLLARYLADPTPASCQLSKDGPFEPIVFVRHETFAEFLLNEGFDLLPNLDQWKTDGWIEDIRVDIVESPNPNSSLPNHITRLNLPIGRHRLIGIRKAILDATDDSNASKVDKKPQPARKTKRSTERGEGREKCIAALTKHHQYADGSCLNLDPIGNNELAKAAEVSTSTASGFFADEFGGHAKYKVRCNNVTGLIAALKLLRNEFSPQDLYGARPPDEDDRDEQGNE